MDAWHLKEKGLGEAGQLVTGSPICSVAHNLSIRLDQCEFYLLIGRGGWSSLTRGPGLTASDATLPAVFAEAARRAAALDAAGSSRQAVELYNESLRWFGKVSVEAIWSLTEWGAVQ